MPEISPTPPRYVLVPLVPATDGFTSVSGHEVTRWGSEGFPEVLAYVYDGKPTITGGGLAGVHVDPVDAIARASVYVSAALAACEMAGQREPADVLALPAPDVIYGAGGPWMLADSAEWSTEGVAVRVWHDGVRVGLPLGMMRTVPAARAHVLASLAAVLYAENLAQEAP